MEPQQLKVEAGFHLELFVWSLSLLGEAHFGYIKTRKHEVVTDVYGHWLCILLSGPLAL